MNYYVITLIIHLDGYENSVKRLAKAENEEAAKLQVLKNESYNESAGYDLENGLWVDDGMIYEIDYIQPVDPEDIQTVIKYIF